MVQSTRSFNRILAMVALVATLFVVFFASFYVTGHANHHCDDERHCPVCTMMVQCERAMKTIGAGVIIAATAFIIVAAAAEMAASYEYQSVQTTLVSQKVRLDS